MCDRSLGGNLEKKQADEWLHAFLFYIKIKMKKIFSTFILLLYAAIMCAQDLEEFYMPQIQSKGDCAKYIGKKISVFDRSSVMDKRWEDASKFDSYYGVTKELFVKVEEINYQIKIDTREITIKQSQVENYNFNQHFTVVIDGKIQTITDDMIESNVLQDVGTYEYKVSLGETSVTLIVKVISDYDIEIINSYNLKEIEIDEINTFEQLPNKM